MQKFNVVDLGNWQATRDTLHAYARVIGSVPRRRLPPHPKWWHISLSVDSAGLSTHPFPLPDGRAAVLRLDASEDAVLLLADGVQLAGWPMAAGLTAGSMADAVFAELEELGIENDFSRAKFDEQGARLYDAGQAALYFTQIAGIAAIFEEHRSWLPAEKGPVQLWPHGFDIAVDWFGTRRVVIESEGDEAEYPASLNLGWSPGESSHPEPYFYSNPWPFDSALLDEPLPNGARWFTSGWQGSIFPHAALVGDPAADERLLAYARRVFELSRPYLDD